MEQIQQFVTDVTFSPLDPPALGRLFVVKVDSPNVKQSQGHICYMLIARLYSLINPTHAVSA